MSAKVHIDSQVVSTSVVVAPQSFQVGSSHYATDAGAVVESDAVWSEAVCDGGKLT